MSQVERTDGVELESQEDSLCGSAATVTQDIEAGVKWEADSAETMAPEQGYM